VPESRLSAAERELLLATDLFTALPVAVSTALADSARPRRLGRGDLLFQEGDPADSLFVVSEGEIAIASRAYDGRESIVAVLASGTLLGELPLFDGEPRSADARAVSPSEVLEVEYGVMRAALEAHPTALWAVTALLAARLRADNEALADAAFLDVPGRTAKRLLEISAGADDFVSPLNQEELAGRVGASRERVNRALATFTRLGWIETIERGHYRLLNRTALERRAAR
jgi:CRP/FNR family transcriptional regulator, cyclic AMP receptor protein